jgi:hypothetical protein
VIPWHLALGALDELQLSIALEPDERLALDFSSSSEWLELPYLRIAMVQPGRQIELHPLHPPARSLPLPRAMAPLDDLWLLVRTPTRRYWFEVPYGVCGTPPEERGSAPQDGPPRPPPSAMLDDAVIPWLAIRFLLGRWDGCQLDLVATSVRPGELELEARRFEPGPPPEVEVTASQGTLRLQDPWRVLATEPEQLHVTRYAFAPDAEARSARSYLRLAVRGASSIELALPSSLTDPAHRSAARRQPPRNT